MPLLDHFHPPLSQRRHWESFHSAWATVLADQLNADWLPEGYIAEEMITVGGRVEIDIATWDESSDANGQGVAVAKKTWTPPAPTRSMPALFPDSFAVHVYSSEGGLKLVAAIELVSPGNKDRDATRQAFAVKCANYLHQGIGLVIVDIVTSRRANLHNVIVQLLAQPDAYRLGEDVSLYTVAYRPITREQQAEIDLWHHALMLGQGLPTMPLALSASACVPVDLETTYQIVCQRRQIIG